MNYNISWSLLKKFLNCNRNFYYKYIEKAEASDYVETKWSRYGNAVHESMEHLKKFNSPLEASINFHKKYELNGKYTVEQVKNCVDYNLEVLEKIGKNIKHNEEVIIFNWKNKRFKAILDVTFEDDTILDWKTSTFKTKSLKDYIQQGMFYVWAKYMKTGKLVKSFYLVFSKEHKWFEYNFTFEEIMAFQEEIIKTLDLIDNKKHFMEYDPNYRGCFFCEFKKLCAKDSIQTPDELTFYLRFQKDRIYIDNEFIDPDLEDVLESHYSYLRKNARFIIEVARSNGNKTEDGIMRLYKRKTRSLPLGFKNDLLAILRGYGDSKKKKVNIEIEDLRRSTPDYEHFIPELKNITLRPYQEKAVKHIIYNPRCIVDICTGAGKTLIATEVIRKLNKISLFIVDEKALLNQTKSVFEEVFNCKVGTIMEGKMNIEPITLCTIQSAISLIKKKDKEFLEYLSLVGLAIVDEAHGARAKSYIELFKRLNCERIVGITGTAYLDGGESLELYRSFGFPSFEIKAKELIQLGYLQEPTIKFLDYKEDFVPNGSYQEIYEDLISQNDRLSKIIDIVKEHKKDKILIIVSRIEYGLNLTELLNEDLIPTEFIRGEVKGECRTNIINQFKEGDELSVLIGTSKIVQKGLDIPDLNVVINTTANLGSIFSIQSIGRILRKSPGKEKAFYYDFNDTHRKLRNHTNSRISYFKSQGYEVNFE